MIWFGQVLWYINYCRLFNAKSCLYIYIKYIWFDLVRCYHISTIVGYLMQILFIDIYIEYMIRKHFVDNILKSLTIIFFAQLNSFNVFYQTQIILYGNYTRMLRAILNKSWRQHPTRHQLYGHLPPIPKTIQVRRTRHAGHCWRSKDELISDVLLWTAAYGQAKAGRPAQTYSSYVRIRDVALKTCQKRWMIGRSGERGSRISVLAARHDDNDDDDG